MPVLQGRVKYFPEQDGSCDCLCPSCGWSEHVPARESEEGEVMSDISGEPRDRGTCGLCQQPFREGEAVVQVVEDRHPTYDKEIVLHTYHKACCESRETVTQGCPHCGCLFHLSLLRRGEEYQNLAQQLFCPFCATLFNCDMGFAAQPPGRSESGLQASGPQAAADAQRANGCPCCGAEIESSPDQDGSCDYYCSRCSWHQHVPGEGALEELGTKGPPATRVMNVATADLRVDRDLLERQAALLGKAADGTSLTDDERRCLGGLWEFVHSVLDSLEAGGDKGN